VVFDYQPDSVRTGWFLSGLGGLMVLGLGAWGAGWPKRRGRPPT
jgi:hypothetical protein